MTDPLIGATTAAFAISLSVALTEPVDVAWSTKDGTAKAGIDYQAASGVVTFLPGETEKQVQVIVYGQSTIGPDKTFYLTLTPPTNAILGNSLVDCIITVVDDEGTPITMIVVAQGKRGFKGDPGLSAYEQAVLMGYTGTVEQWMAEIADASEAALRSNQFANDSAGYAANSATSAYEAANIAVTVTALNNGQEYYLTQVELLAATPSVTKKAAKALDTKKVWLWQKPGAPAGTWTDTGLSELDQAIALFTPLTTGVEQNRVQNPNKFTYEQSVFATMPTATTGTPTVLIRNGIKQLKLVSAGTGGSIIAQWDFPVAQFTREFAACLTLEGVTAGSNGLVGIQQLAANGSILASTYAATGMTAAITKQLYKMNVSTIVANVVTIRLIVNLMTTTTREMYIHSPFIAEGLSAEYIAPIAAPNITALTGRVDKLDAAFDTVVVSNKNKFNPALAENGKLISYSNGQNVTYSDGIAFGKHPVEAGKTYTFWIPTSSTFSFAPVIYAYASNGTFLGMDHSIPSAGEVVNPNPPTGIAYSDSNKTVTFTIPSGSSIAFIALMAVYSAHTTDQFNTLVASMQLEEGSSKTAFEPYNPDGGTKLVLKQSALPSITIPDTSVPRNTFTVTTDGTHAFVRTAYNATHDLVQKVRYGTNDTWSNNMINPFEVRTIAKTTAKDGTIAAFTSGSLLALQGDDATPLFYNDTYIGANHGAFIVHEVTANAHGKSYADVGSRWTQGANTWTIVRIVDANKLWLVSQNTGSTYWQFVNTALTGLTLTHSIGATNTASFTPSADVTTQLLSAVNNHTKRIVVDGFRDITAINAVYDVLSVEFIDVYDIMNPPAILTYLQSRTGTMTEQPINSNTIASDMRVSANYRYAFNGSCVVNTQLQSKAAINFTFAGFVQANVLTYTGKTLLQYVPKVGSIVGPSKTWNFANVEDISTTIDSINFLKANWIDALNPPDRMAQIVKNGATKEFGHVVGYSLARGITKPSVRQATDNAGFVHTSRKMYPKAITANIYPSGLMPAGTVLNAVAYRSIFNAAVLPSATVFTWYEDNGAIYVVLDMHQNASMLTLPLPDVFNGKTAAVVDSNANFTLHSEMVNDGGLLVSITNGYGQATIKLS